MFPSWCYFAHVFNLNMNWVKHLVRKQKKVITIVLASDTFKSTILLCLVRHFPWMTSDPNVDAVFLWSAINHYKMWFHHFIILRTNMPPINLLTVMFSLNRFIFYYMWQDNSAEAYLMANKLEREQQIRYCNSWSCSAPDSCTTWEHFLKFVQIRMWLLFLEKIFFWLNSL